MLLSLGHELLCAIVEHVSLRPHILQIAGTCRALCAAVLAHSCWHNVELVGKSLEQLELMCFLRVPLRRLTLTFVILESPLVLHLLESCGAAQLEHLTLRRVVGFYHASLGGAAWSNSAEVLAGQCRVASVARGVHRCDDRLIQPGAGFLPLALAATPRLRSLTCSNVDMADLAHLPPLPHLEVADLGAACEASHLVDRYHRDPSRFVPMFSHGRQIPIVLNAMPALTRLRVSGFQFGVRLTIRAPALERLKSLLKNNVYIARLDCPRLNEVACQHGVRSRCTGFVLLDTYGDTWCPGMRSTTPPRSSSSDWRTLSQRQACQKRPSDRAKCPTLWAAHMIGLLPHLASLATLDMSRWSSCPLAAG